METALVMLGKGLERLETDRGVSVILGLAPDWHSGPKKQRQDSWGVRLGLSTTILALLGPRKALRGSR